MTETLQHEKQRLFGEGQHGRTFSTAYGYTAAVVGLQRTAMCSLRYRSPTSVSVGPLTVGDASGSGSPPGLDARDHHCRLFSACSAVVTPCCPMAIRRDFQLCRVCTGYTLGPLGPNPVNSRFQDTTSLSAAEKPSTVRLLIRAPAQFGHSPAFSAVPVRRRPNQARLFPQIVQHRTTGGARQVVSLPSLCCSAPIPIVYSCVAHLRHWERLSRSGGTGKTLAVGSGIFRHRSQ